MSMGMKKSKARCRVDYRSGNNHVDRWPAPSSLQSNPKTEQTFPITFTCAHERTETALTVSLVKFQVRKIMCEMAIAISSLWHRICIILPVNIRTGNPAAKEPSHGDSTTFPIFRVFFRNPYPSESSSWNQQSLGSLA